MDALRQALQTEFGLDDFRPAQREVIEHVLAGRDVLCVMPTGAGKSLCYQLPAVLLARREGGAGITLVVSPLISLMQDQVQQLQEDEIPARLLCSAQSSGEQRAVLGELAAGWSGLLYVAPERFYTHAFASLLRRLRVNLLAVDEAHCISQWGHDFRPEYGMLGDVRRRIAEGRQGTPPPTIALTATATHDVRGHIIHHLELADPAIYVTGFDRPNLRYACESHFPEGKSQRLVSLVRQQKGSVLVYCATRKSVEEVRDTLTLALKGRRIVAYHAGMDAADRTAAQEAWMDGEDPRRGNVVAVCTNAFGMGVNKPDTRLVVHYAMPGTLEAYYQEAGRAGRDGEPADCILLYSYADRMTQEFFISRIGTSRRGDDHAGPMDDALIEQLKLHATDKLARMTEYAQTHACRRQMILDYFGDATLVDSQSCHCDVCARGRIDPASMPAATPVSDETTRLIRQMLSAVARACRVGSGFGVLTLADLLCGDPTDRLTRHGLTSVPTFGALADIPHKRVVAMLHRLMDAGLARQKDVNAASDGGFSAAGSSIARRPVVVLTAAGLAVMKGDRPPPGVLADLAKPKTKAPRSRTPRPTPSLEVELDPTAT